VDADSGPRLWILIGNAAAQPNATTIDIVFVILVLFILILVNATFSASEMAVITLNDSKVRRMAEEGDKKSKKILKFIDRPTRFLSTIQVGITFAGFFASAFAADKIAAPLTAAIDPGNVLPWLGTFIVVLTTMLLSFFSLVYGELVPKRVAMRMPYGVLKYTLGILTFTSFILKPFVFFLTFSTNVSLRIMGINPEEHEKTVTEEEIRMMVDVGRESGSIHENEKEMIENIFEFNDTQVSEIMTPRTHIVSLDITADFQEVLSVAVTEKFTRIPVYRDSIDNIIGILHIKDLLTMATVGTEKPFSLESMIREPFIVPESKTIDETFHEMQTKHEQIAVVIDE
jgi:putative hemolysin